MHWPYSLDFTESFFAAQSCAALMLTALLLFWRVGSLASRGAMLLGIWLTVVAYALPGVVVSLGYKAQPELMHGTLAVAAMLGTLSAALALRPLAAVVGFVGQVPLWLVSEFVKDSDGELCALHLAWLGLVLGLLVRAAAARAPARDAPTAEPERSYFAHDTVAFLAATVLAALVCLVVMRKRDGSADEWGYTYQAAVFAKGRLYAQSPRCQNYLESFYVYESAGRLFSQYTPGWPLFIAPFVALHVTWLSGPVTMGILAVGMARLSRTAMRGFGRYDGPPAARAIRAAGTWGALLAMLGTTILINGASRYAHVFTVALHAWALEALLVATMPGLPRVRQLRWGLALGCAAALGVAVRPADGAFAGIGIAVYFVYALARRRVGWRAFAMAAAAFAFWTVLVLVVLRLQLGRWFTTGYSLNAVIHPWNVVKYSRPLPTQWKYGLPLATGAYCWWPCSLALGLAGLATVRGRARGLVVAIALGCIPYVVYCMFLDVGQRGYDWGYGPRYLMMLVVPMAVGGAVALSPLTVAATERVTAGRRSLARGGPLALAIFAVVCGWIRIVPLVYPTVVDHTRKHSALQRAIDEAYLTNAIVIAQQGTTGFDPHDLTTNLPVDLYPDQNVLIAIDNQSPKEAVDCLRGAYPGRKLFTASGYYEDIRIVPTH